MNEFILNKNSYIGYFRNMVDDLDVVADALKITVEENEEDTLKEVYKRRKESAFYGEAYEYLTVGIFEKVEEFAELVEPFTIRTLLNNTNKELLEIEFNALNKIYTILGVNISEFIKVIESKMILDEEEFNEVYSRIIKNIDDALNSYHELDEDRNKILENKYRKSIWLYSKINDWEEANFYTRKGKEE